MDYFNKKVEIFAELLKKFNKIHSLTNYTDINFQAQDSIEPLKYLDFSPKIAIDVGSGAGFPAIFLAIILDKCKWHLYEPNAKKSSFLRLVKIKLNLDNIIVHDKKIQDCDKFKADLITSRALSKTADLVKICDGFYDKETKFLLYKGSSVEDEIDGFDTKIYNNKNRNYLIVRNV